VQWNKELLFDAYYSDPEGTRLAAGAYQGPVSTQTSRLAKGGEFWCPVLYENVPLEFTFSMGCEGSGQPEHRFSIEAWQEYLLNKVTDGFSSIFSQCLYRGCKCVVSPRVWRYILSADVPLSVATPGASKEADAESRRKVR